MDARLARMEMANDRSARVDRARVAPPRTRPRDRVARDVDPRRRPTLARPLDRASRVRTRAANVRFDL